MGLDLLPSERVLWTGKPVRFPVLDRSAIFLALKSAEYTVTDQRIILLTKVFGRHRQQSAYLTDLPPVTLVERDGGVGTLRFGDSGSLADFFPSRKNGQSRPPFALREIENAHVVRDTIATARLER